MLIEGSMQALLAADSPERALAARYAPLIRFDDREPFVPDACGYTVFRSDGPSPSFPRDITLGDAELAIEYAIWWDWDIGHLYELEHVWVWVDRDGRVIACEASAHGGYAPMPLTLDGDRPVLLSEPGKHAFATDDARFPRRTGRLSSTNFLAGVSGVLVKDVYAGLIDKTPLADRLVRTYLQRHAFDAAWSFEKRHVLSPERLVPWKALDAWIPSRLEWWLGKLRAEIPREEYRFLRIGHRGAKAHAPDNSLRGVEIAADLGADMVEIDVRLDAEGVPVLSHDPVRPGCPRLDEALRLCASLAMGVYLELKDGDAIPTVVDAVRAARVGGTTIVASFVPEWLAEYKRIAPRARTSVLFGRTDVDPVALAASCGATFVHPCWERFEDPTEHLTLGWVDRVREAGLGVVCWHEERPDVIAKIRSRGVDGVCSDAPERLT